MVAPPALHRNHYHEENIIAVTHSAAVRTAIATAVLGAIDAGTNSLLVFRATGNVAAPGAEIATLTCSDPSGTVSGPTLTYSAITADSSATGGTVATATMETSAGTVCVHCAVTVATGDINMSSLVIGATDTVSCSALSYTAPA